MQREGMMIQTADRLNMHLRVDGSYFSELHETEKEILFTTPTAARPQLKFCPGYSSE